tara:strand:+ start:2840 stop:3082 length:243 start_codon:yes stop_codon:yes gene_type:complete
MIKLFMMIILVATLILLLQMYKPILESMEDGGIVCPPVGKSGVIECPHIEDKKLRDYQCEAIKNHCQVITDSEAEKNIIN